MPRGQSRVICKVVWEIEHHGEELSTLSLIFLSMQWWVTDYVRAHDPNGEQLLGSGNQGPGILFFYKKIPLLLYQGDFINGCITVSVWLLV